MFEQVSKEILEKAQKAKTKEEVLAILKQAGIELTEDDLNTVSGGAEDSVGGPPWCPIQCAENSCNGDLCRSYCPE